MQEPALVDQVIILWVDRRKKRPWGIHCDRNSRGAGRSHDTRKENGSSV